MVQIVHARVCPIYYSEYPEFLEPTKIDPYTVRWPFCTVLAAPTEVAPFTVWSYQNTQIVHAQHVMKFAERTCMQKHGEHTDRAHGTRDKVRKTHKHSVHAYCTCAKRKESAYKLGFVERHFNILPCSRGVKKSRVFFIYVLSNIFATMNEAKRFIFKRPWPILSIIIILSSAAW